jgi:hypothetical protein
VLAFDSRFPPVLGVFCLLSHHDSEFVRSLSVYDLRLLYGARTENQERLGDRGLGGGGIQAKQVQVRGLNSNLQFRDADAPFFSAPSLSFPLSTLFFSDVHFDRGRARSLHLHALADYCPGRLCYTLAREVPS